MSFKLLIHDEPWEALDKESMKVIKIYFRLFRCDEIMKMYVRLL